jgi:hypothetical protein
VSNRLSAPVDHRAVQISELIDAVALNLLDKVRLKPGIAKLGWVAAAAIPGLSSWDILCRPFGTVHIAIPTQD